MILVASDGSADAGAAMRIALDVAARGGEDVVVAAVWREFHATLGLPIGVETERRWAHEAAAATARVGSAVGLEPEVVLRHGWPGDEICKLALERGAHMVVMGSRGLGPVASILLGSVSGYVIRHAPCPVLIVRDSTPAQHDAKEST